MTTKTFGVAQDPVMGGFEFRQGQLNHPRFANIPVIVVSAAADPQATGRLRADALLQKPADVGQFLALVKRYCPKRLPRRWGGAAFKHEKCFRLAVTRTLSPKQDSTRRRRCGSTAIIVGL